MTDSVTGLTVSDYLDDERFHRKFTLPVSASRSEEIKVTYADFGDCNNERVLLVCPPLLGSRYLLVTKDKLARQHGVRIISPDRPGFGGTTDVPPHDRVRTWLEIVEALLAHLDIKRVSILGYSGGAIYSMNVLLHLRHLLHPDRPFIALCAPWVHTTHSGVSTLKILGLMPNGVLGSYDRVLQIFGNVSPALKFSTDLAGLIPSLSRGYSSSTSNSDPDTAIILEQKMFPELLRRITTESVKGISQDALMLLKREQFPGCWGIWTDYDTLLPLLAEKERQRCSTCSGDAPKLKVRVFFAESDHMIGTSSAPEWLDNCWRPERCGDGIDYTSTFVPRTTHDSILDLRFGVIERILREMAL
ncbi:Alpha/Beta hydrolase protein [Xylariaceae sp. FL0255]|nr:Alpha/Beta hydrolase protein [Xylariaceae sp. FL0255]